MKKAMNVLVSALLATTFTLAGTLSGTIREVSSDITLPNARVAILNTSFTTLANVDGTYKFKAVPDGEYEVKVTFPGFAAETKSVTVNGDTTLDFDMEPSNIQEEISVTANRAMIRETPVAFTNVTGDAIKKQYTTQDTPELLKSVPGVFSRTNGLGESDLYVRGFDSERVQIMINNVPVNDPESQVVYWSNWTGLSGNAADIQVQRGVGSSLYGSGAFGGSVNIATDNFSVEQSASAMYTYGAYDGGNDQYKGAADYSTGFFNNDRMNLYFRYERKAGDSYIDGTKYDGHSFYLGFLYQPNDKHSLTFNFHGAPQDHNQAANVQDPALLELYGRTWNRRNHPFQENYFFKPVFEIHHDWVINSNSHFRATFFATSGTGGGRYLRNDLVNDTGETLTGLSNLDGTLYAGNVLPGGVYAQNGGRFNRANRNYSPAFSLFGNSFKNDSQNKHDQYGFNFSYKNILNQYVTFVAGGEARVWDADHFAKSDFFLFGDENEGKPIEVVDSVEYRYDYNGKVSNASGYVRGQFSPNSKLTIMLDANINLYKHEVTENNIRQYDFYNRAWTDIYHRFSRDVVTDWDASGGSASATVTPLEDLSHDQLVDLMGDNADAMIGADPSTLTADEIIARLLDNYDREYEFFQPKFGINYNVNDHWNVFVNYSEAKKEPKVGDWYNRTSLPLSENQLKEEELEDLEFGLAYRTRKMTLNLNYYSMAFTNKIESITDSNGDRETINAGNIDFEGFEAAFSWAINRNLTFQASGTFADNEVVATNPNIDFIFGNPVEEVVGSKYPGSPQTILYAQLTYSTDNWDVGLSYNSWDDYYVLFDNDGSDIVGLDDKSRLPQFEEINLRGSYTWKLGNGNKFSVSAFANNIADHDHYVNATYSRDFGRSTGSGPYLGVTQAATFNWFLSADYRF